MATATQYNPNKSLNEQLLAVGASKTVYALVTPETEHAKARLFGDQGDMIRQHYLDQFREAWTGKQDALHEEFFSTWHEWSSPVVDFDRAKFPFYYPCNGASEPIRHLIYKMGGDMFGRIYFFEGEYEGYKAMAEAAGVRYTEIPRDDWRDLPDRMEPFDKFFLSQPSAIDGNVWPDYNEFVASMPLDSVVVDVTYVGAVPMSAVPERFNLNADSIHAVIFSLSKPFGVYYDRIGGVWMREEDPGLFGNKWFKNLTSISLGVTLMQFYSVGYLPKHYAALQREQAAKVSEALGFDLKPSDVFILATAEPTRGEMSDYLNRAGRVRLCLSAGMAGSLKYA